MQSIRTFSRGWPEPGEPPPDSKRPHLRTSQSEEEVRPGVCVVRWALMHQVRRATHGSARTQEGSTTPGLAPSPISRADLRRRQQRAERDCAVAARHSGHRRGLPELADPPPSHASKLLNLHDAPPGHASFYICTCNNNTTALRQKLERGGPCRSLCPMSDVLAWCEL